MEKKGKTLNYRLCEPEDADTRVEGIFEEEIIDIEKQCQKPAAKKKPDHTHASKVYKNKART